MKYVIVIGDGMADVPIPQLGGRTPLQSADMKQTRALQTKATIGRVRTVPIGLPPGSDTAILSIFGYDPVLYYTGRSPLEAAGCGVPVHEGEICFRMNIVSLEGDDYQTSIMRSHNGGGIEGVQAETLIRFLLEDACFTQMLADMGMTIYPMESFRHIAVLKNGSDEPFSFTPPHEILDQPISTYLNKGQCAQAIIALQARASEILRHHPINQARVAGGLPSANGIWLWGEGRAVTLPDFHQKNGHRGAAITAVPLVHGIAHLCGLDAPLIQGATGAIDTNYHGKVDAALQALAQDDFAILHVEAPDELAHAGDLEGKIHAMELLDEKLLTPLIEQLRAKGDFRLLFLPDHPTPIPTRNHSGEPVPYLLYDSTQEQNHPDATFDEVYAATQPLIEAGHTLLSTLFHP